ncbi:hypothetical protein H9Q09_00640 [Aurantimonas sp. DM33-3]|uniref:hypothetical protein n=1 Tax=Aurantimonas sp. DM33-3 TaxID=2766955 RepID=UPI001651EFC3|nr:hypothetical protein [Aurantimonas sp. DM33-3]MBC6714692.1 hypothetical protein [Aurantimonas sp. DM33-3]
MLFADASPVDGIRVTSAGYLVARAKLARAGVKTPRGGGFGGPIPERPMLRSTMRANRGKYQHAMKAEMRGIVRAIIAGHRVDPEAILSRLGILAQGDVQSTITSLQSPPNSPVTIRLKGSSSPLIDTGEMRARVSYSVEKSSGGGLLSSVARSVFR